MTLKGTRFGTQARHDRGQGSIGFQADGLPVCASGDPFDDPQIVHASGWELAALLVVHTETHHCAHRQALRQSCSGRQVKCCLRVLTRRRNGRRGPGIGLCHVIESRTVAGGIVGQGPRRLARSSRFPGRIGCWLRWGCGGRCLVCGSRFVGLGRRHRADSTTGCQQRREHHQKCDSTCGGVDHRDSFT